MSANLEHLLGGASVPSTRPPGCDLQITSKVFALRVGPERTFNPDAGPRGTACHNDPAVTSQDVKIVIYYPCQCMSRQCSNVLLNYERAGVYLQPDHVLAVLDFVKEARSVSNVARSGKLEIAAATFRHFSRLAGPGPFAKCPSEGHLPPLLNLQLVRPPRYLNVSSYCFSSDKHTMALQLAGGIGHVTYRLISRSDDCVYYELTAIPMPESETGMASAGSVFNVTLTGALIDFLQLRPMSAILPSTTVPAYSPGFSCSYLGHQVARYTVPPDHAYVVYNMFAHGVTRADVSQGLVGNGLDQDQDSFFVSRPATTPIGALFLQARRFLYASSGKSSSFPLESGASWKSLFYFGSRWPEKPFVPATSSNCPHFHQHYEDSLGRSMLRSNILMRKTPLSCLTLRAALTRNAQIAGVRVCAFKDQIVQHVFRRNPAAINAVAMAESYDPFRLPHPWGPMPYTMDFEIDEWPNNLAEVVADMRGTHTELYFTEGEEDGDITARFRYQGLSLPFHPTGNGIPITTLKFKGYLKVNCPCCGQPAPVPPFMTQAIVDKLYDSPYNAAPARLLRGEFVKLSPEIEDEWLDDDDDDELVFPA